MSARAHWIAIVLLTGAFTAAVTATMLEESEEEPAVPVSGPTSAPAPAPPPSTPPSAEAAACAAAADVLRELAAGRAPSGVVFASQFAPADERPEDTAIALARTEITPLMSPLACSCRDTECTASIIWDVHHAMYMTFASNAYPARLVRVQSIVGGW